MNQCGPVTSSAGRSWLTNTHIDDGVQVAGLRHHHLHLPSGTPVAHPRAGSRSRRRARRRSDRCASTAGGSDTLPAAGETNWSAA
jgi:hypothetical protein